ANMPQQIQVVAAGEQVGVVTTPDGKTVPLITAASAHAILVPGEFAERTITLTSIASGPAGAPAGVVLVTTPQGELEVPIVTAAEIAEPDLGWRLSHPLRLWGVAE